MTLPTLGRSHALIRRTRDLRRERGLRDREGVFLAEGLKLADEALRAEVPVERALVSPRLSSRDDGRALLERMQAAGWDVFEVADTVLDSLQEARTPQPVLTIVQRRDLQLADVLATSQSTSRLVVVAHAIQDPGNLGSLVRTADASGADAFIVSGATADLFHPRAVRASAGSIFRMATCRDGEDDLLERLNQVGLQTIATVPGQGTDYSQMPVEQSLAVFVGNEGAGLPAELVERIRHRVSIPMREGVDSLSVGAAAAVLLFEIARRRRDG